MELLITIPDSYPAEREYIISVIFKDFLGLDYVIKRAQGFYTNISNKEDKRRLLIPDGLFANPGEKWLTPQSLPKQPLQVRGPQIVESDFGIEFSPIPVIYGSQAFEIDGTTQLASDRDLYIPIDIFGSCFFMLTRYEEIVKPDRDEHDRFPAKASLAYQEGFIERPIVNEYLEILWASLKRLWPGLTRKRREYRLILSHDVDNIFCVVGKPLRQVLKRVGGDIIARHDPYLAFGSMKAAWKGLAEKDPCNNFDFIMDTSEKLGVKSTFNFMGDLGDTVYDQRYDIDHPWVRACIRRIAKRGHLIGIHTTYGSYLNPERTKGEFQRLRDVAEEEGVKQEEWGGCQHYLRWQNPTTWQNLEDAGLDYETSLAYADQTGFRSGTCYEYPVFNIKTRQRLRLRERPILVMESTLLKCMRLPWTLVIRKIIKMNQLCRLYRGDFTMLWHNDLLLTRRDRNKYQEVCKTL